MEPEPKIPEGELIAWTVVLVICDILDFVFVSLPISDVIEPFLIWYLSTKGVNYVGSVVAGVLELVPVVDFLPLKTAGFALSVYLDRHPEAAGSIPGGEEALALASKANLKGGGSSFAQRASVRLASLRGGEADEEPDEEDVEEEYEEEVWEGGGSGEGEEAEAQPEKSEGERYAEEVLYGDTKPEDASSPLKAGLEGDYAALPGAREERRAA